MVSEPERLANACDAELRGIWDGIIELHLRRGEGTGATSKILSNTLFPMAAALAAYLIHERQFISLLTIGVLMWTRIGSVVLVSGLIYFVIAQQWIAAGLLTLCLIATASSIYFGRRNVERLVRSGKPMISPFEGMQDLLLILFFECAFIVSAILTYGWVSIVFWILFVLTAIHHAVRLGFRLCPKWRQVHNPLMIRYAGIAGREFAQSEREERDFNFYSAARDLLATVYLGERDDEIEQRADEAADKLDSFADRDLVARVIQSRTRSLPREHCERILDEIFTFLQSDKSQKLIVRYAIAEVVESVFDETVRGEYLLAVFSGQDT